MERNEIYKAYGTEYRKMTARLLEQAGLAEHIQAKAVSLEGPAYHTPAKGLCIAIKPNLVTSSPAEFGGTTHPEVVAGIVDYLRTHGFTNLVIMEGSWVGDKTEDAYEYCGYRALCEELNLPFIDTQKQPFFSRDCAGMKLQLCQCVRDIDFLINVPVLKGHCQTKMTCALKNLKGLLPNREKRRFHTMGLHSPIAHLNTGIRQDFIVTDHICGDPDFEEGGSPLVRNCVMASLDPVLTDAYAARLLGYEPEEIPYIGLAEQLAIGTADLSRLKIVTVEGENTEDRMSDATGAAGRVKETNATDAVSHRLLDVSYSVEEAESCSACYGMLTGALFRLQQEGLTLPQELRLAIGQGFRGKTGSGSHGAASAETVTIGIGNCTAGFAEHVPGCPPAEEDIYAFLKSRI